jgi:ATP-dependent RNA helicase RhlE
MPRTGRHQEKKISSTFNQLGLRAELVRALREQDYVQPTPIQQQAIPHVLAGRDVVGAAQTGTGKTAAFTLPLLQHLSASPATERRRPVRALVLTPTRELAIQVEQSVRTYGSHLHLRSAAIYGGVGMKGQLDALRAGVDIVVATPGRLLDHLGQKTLSLAQITHVVLDEADRMLDMGFIHDMRRILALLPRERQTLFFSATFPAEVRRLAAAFLRDPVEVQVAAPNATVNLVAQSVHSVAQSAKRALLAFLIREKQWPQVLVFTRTKHGANRLAEQLTRDGIPADAIHGNKSQGQRIRALDRFKDLKVQVLVATDIAARGIDITELACVVNYDLPMVAEDYVHRIGRTARAGASGEAVSLVAQEEKPQLAAIEALIRQKLERRTVEGFVPPPAEVGSGTSAARAPGQRGSGRGEQQTRAGGEKRGGGNRQSNGEKRGAGKKQANGEKRGTGEKRAGRATRGSGPAPARTPAPRRAPGTAAGAAPERRAPAEDRAPQQPVPSASSVSPETERGAVMPFRARRSTPAGALLTRARG